MIGVGDELEIEKIESVFFISCFFVFWYSILNDELLEKFK